MKPDTWAVECKRCHHGIVSMTTAELRAAPPLVLCAGCAGEAALTHDEVLTECARHRIEADRIREAVRALFAVASKPNGEAARE